MLSRAIRYPRVLLHRSSICKERSLAAFASSIHCGGEIKMFQAKQRQHVFHSQSITNRLHQNRLFSVMPKHDQLEDTVEQNIATQESELQIRSKPKPGGNWNPNDPLGWTKSFGRRNPEHEKELLKRAHLKPGDEGYFDVNGLKLTGVTIVRTKEEARIVMKKLMSPESEKAWHACDTEVMDIDLKNVGPVGNGYVTCLSMFSGPDFDYGLGEPPGTALWIDNLDDSFGVLQEFKEFFEDTRFKTVWHNYGFDRHVMWNEGIDVKCFGADTIHMARLLDTSRAAFGAGKGYSLEALTDDMLNRRKKPMKEIFGVPRLKKDGTPGSLIDIPNVEVMQRDPRFRAKWIVYSCYDAEGTYYLREVLQKKLEEKNWFNGKNLFEYYDMHLRKFGEVLTDMERRGIRVDARDYLAKVETQAREDRSMHVATFRKWAYKMIGPDGLALNPASSNQLSVFLFGGSLNEKTKETTESVRVFKTPRDEIPDDAMEIYKQRNLQHQKEITSNGQEGERPPDEFDAMKVNDLKLLCKERGLKVSGKKSELQERLRGHFLASGNGSDLAKQDDFDTMTDDELREVCISRGLPVEGNRKTLLERIRQDVSFTLELLSSNNDISADGYKRVTAALEAAAASDGGVLKDIMDNLKAKSQEEPKFVDVTVTSLGMTPSKYTAGGAPSVTADVLRALAGDPFVDPPKYGTAYNFFGGGQEGHDACVALYSLTAIGSIDTMIANFLTSLQALCDHDSRVHGSINFNTETGRLSSRRPNLQNQPALEKDKYKIRKAFQASPGNKLIVADYGQLELRLLASMTNCVSMIEAFEAGGDFHSRTALGMFDYIQKKVDSGDVLLEWDYSQGDPPKPMLKDEFASERRKAKTLNFSIAYGKTAHGLSQDWGVSIQEAESMLQAWYNSRPEVRKWQEDTKTIAKKKGYTRTLMGRYRDLPQAMGNNQKLVGHALRASINTPIQGGAADVAMMAMNKINSSEKLQRLGWILLLQVHDEVILEGPEETAEEAFKEVIQCMQEPWTIGLEKTSVPLLVDGSYQHDNWFEAK